MLHAHEMSGLLLLLTICLYCHLEWDKNHKGAITNNSFVACLSRASRLKEFRELIEMLEEWMKQDVVDKAMVTPRRGVLCAPYDSAGKEALRMTMAKYVSVVNRKSGHGLKHVKTHSVLHVPQTTFFRLVHLIIGI
jgi:hypothetical protein